jgi:hypothetical protein
LFLRLTVSQRLTVLKITCTNQVCPNPNSDKTFLWDETRYIAPKCRVTGRFVAGAQRLIAHCTYCSTPYTLYVVCPPDAPGGSGAGGDEVTFNGGVKKDDPRKVIDIPGIKEPPRPAGAT